VRVSSFVLSFRGAGIKPVEQNSEQDPVQARRDDADAHEHKYNHEQNSYDCGEYASHLFGLRYHFPDQAKQ
jgi:hypothetical protein